jgi:hypothetical protein
MASIAMQKLRTAMRRFLPVQLAQAMGGRTIGDDIAFSRAWAQV